MTIEFVLFIAILAFVSSAASAWAFGYVASTQKQRILDMYHRINYLEVGMSYHGLIPMPWEEELEGLDNKLKGIKQEGNVVYLQKEE